MIKRFNRFMNSSILLSALFMIIGIVFILLPKESLTTVSYVISFLLIIYGIFLFTMDCKYGNLLFIDNFANGILSVIFGIIILMYPKFLASIIPIVLGILFIISSLFKIRVSISLKGETEYWLISLLLSILSIVCGIILIINPFESAVTVTLLMGIILVIYSVTDMLDMIIFKKNINDIAKKIKKSFKELD